MYKGWKDDCIVCKILNIAGNYGYGDWGSIEAHEEISNLLKDKLPQNFLTHDRKQDYDLPKGV